MRTAIRVFAITAISYTPILLWISLLPLLDRNLSIVAALACAAAFLGLAMVALIWAVFALVLSYRETPKRHRAGFWWIAIGFFALPLAAWLLIAA